MNNTPNSTPEPEALREGRSANPPLLAELIEALRDMNNGWKYIRSTHGDLYGVGWDRAQNKADAALAKVSQGCAPEPVASVSPEESKEQKLFCGYARIKDNAYELAGMRSCSTMADGDWHPIYSAPLDLNKYRMYAETKALAAVLRCRYPVAGSIHPSGWGWDESRLNEVIDELQHGPRD